MKNIQKLFSALGPGLLWAGAAVGVSHLVQSTKAGAQFGFSMILIVLVANLFKYPFFEFGPRYAAATGHTLLTGYKKMGNWAFYLYLLLTAATMFIIQAVVTIVTSGVIKYLFNVPISPQLLSIIVMVGSFIILLLGHYSTLDKVIKWVIIFLTFSTLIAVVVALTKVCGTADAKDIWATVNPKHFMETPHKKAWLLFLIPLMGWMPSAVDISVWSSIWTTEKHKENPEATTLKNSLLDFNVGYIGTIIIALCFLTLGALMMFLKSKEYLPAGSEQALDYAKMPAATFAGNVIGMYTKSIGVWSKYLVGFAALATMFSTTITCLDAYGRVCAKAQSLVQKGHDEDESSYLNWVLITIIGATIVLYVGKEMGSSFAAMIAFATSVSFLTSPILGFLNLKVVTSKEVPLDARPGKRLVLLSWLGLIFLTVFSVFYIKELMKPKVVPAPKVPVIASVIYDSTTQVVIIEGGNFSKSSTVSVKLPSSSQFLLVPVDTEKSSKRSLYLSLSPNNLMSEAWYFEVTDVGGKSNIDTLYFEHNTEKFWEAVDEQRIERPYNERKDDLFDKFYEDDAHLQEKDSLNQLLSTSDTTAVVKNTTRNNIPEEKEPRTDTTTVVDSTKK